VHILNFNVPLGAGQTLTILSASSIAGSFQNVASGSRLATIDGRGSFLVSYGSGSPFEDSDIVLSNFLLAADFDEDGDVDGDDLTRWRTGFGIGVAHGDGDADADGDVDGRDFLIWQRQLGSTPAVAIQTAVPEPSAAWLALAAGVAWSAVRRRRGPGPAPLFSEVGRP
jgi:hypothetical protein